MSYMLYGPDPSAFTRKLEAALIFYGAPFERVSEIGDQRELLQSRAGTHQLPVLGTPENWVLADTTPIMSLLDGRFPRRRLFPGGPVGFLVHVLEDVLDEWVSRVYVHYRWHYAENTQHALARLGADILNEAAALTDWGQRSCRATGTEPMSQRTFAEAEYLALMAAADAQLARAPYLLGERPCAVDAALLGGLRAHTHHDPLPDLGEFPHVIAYAEGACDRWDGDGELAPFAEPTDFAQHLLRLAGDYYAPFIAANRRARDAGNKAFEITVYGESVSFMARAYPEVSRELLVRHYRDQLASEEQEIIRRWLATASLDQLIA
ncbi:MAG: glutathione S-transferase N-terminal domain-containing protein [Gammaproteobacteria bacterium]|jgi:glutathione S-transferase